MTQNAVLRESVPNCGIESAQIVDALAGETSLPVKILINVRDGRGVRIETSLPTEYLRQARASGRLHAYRYSRPHQRIAFSHHLGLSIEYRNIEWVRRRSDHLRGRVAGKLSVGIQCYHETYSAHTRQIADRSIEPISSAE